MSKPALPLRTGSKPSPQEVGAVVASSGSWVVPFAPDYSVFAETVDQSIQGRLDEAHDFLELHSAALRRQGFDVETKVEIADRAEDAIIDFARALKPTFIIMTGDVDLTGALAASRGRRRSPAFLYGARKTKPDRNAKGTLKSDLDPPSGSDAL